MKISIETPAFNERRYGKPWIARVDYSLSISKPDFKWGEWAGDARNGSAGLLEIEASPGDIVATGQRDTRKMRNSSPGYFQVTPEGTLSPLTSPAAAVAAFRANQTPVTTQNETE